MSHLLSIDEAVHFYNVLKVALARQENLRKYSIFYSMNMTFTFQWHLSLVGICTLLDELGNREILINDTI